MTDRSLDTAANDVLDVASAALASATYDGESLAPTRAYVATGDGYAVEGCATLVVYASSIEVAAIGADGSVATPPLPAAGCVLVPVANVVVEAHVCVATGDESGQPPTVAATNAAAGKVTTLAMTLVRALLTARRDGTLPDAEIGTATLTGPSGGVAGVSIPVRLVLPAPVSDGS